MTAFTTVNLTPDIAQLVAWLLTVGLAWFQSMTPQQVLGGCMVGMWALTGVIYVGVRRCK